MSESSGVAAIAKRPRRRLAGGIAALVLASSTALLWLSGSVHARITWAQPGGWGDTWRHDRKVFTTDVLIKNEGWTALRIVGVGQDEPGLRLIASDGLSFTHPVGKRSVPFTLQPGETAAVTIAYQVTDCAAVAVGKLAIPVRIERMWGTETASVTHPTYQEANGQLILNYQGADAVEWQRALADTACGSA